ncbi:formate dehydrogenase subunit alpha [Thermofilum pendens]|uniref:Formate dehydrogenase, alpha subunit n=1 Tax=Thermofilum pendens (strain DSM 2475 / Hrk 5) TaxID=368408 RepID=A1RWM0_THEPD|nr:formate dehydrogenase subunit alpha [Thermofilum pendens]ABL77600.1 formate dehydrogenase, alpha subunit [Thermofilum pendens Hrk 5]
MGRKVKVICPYCGVGCGFYISVDDYGNPVGIEHMPEHPVNRGKLCPKGRSALDVLRAPDRLTKPLKRTESGEFKEISWSDAIREVAENLNNVRKEYGPQAVGFLASARVFNEENYAMQKLARVFGTNNIDHCARLCHAPSLAGLSATVGAGAMTAPFEDIAASNFILIWGYNPAETHPILMGQYILKAKEKGAKIAVVDTRCTRTAWHADYFIPIKPGTDLAVIYAMINVIIQEKLYDEKFVKERVERFDDLARFVSKYTPEYAESVSGAPAHLIRQVAREFAKAGKASICWCMGITQHTKGTNNVIGLATLAAICGYYGKEGCAVAPVRGQNNVQGACDMGALPVFLPGYARVIDAEKRKKVASAWGLDDLPAEPGYTVIEMSYAAEQGKLKAMYIMGENPLISDANANHVRKALEHLDFLVVQDIFLTETAQLADIVLPSACWAEKEGSFTNTERRVQWSFKAVEPPGEAKPDWVIITEIAKALGLERFFPYTRVEDITAEINKVVPQYAGITAERLKNSIGGILWPCPSPDHPGTARLHVEKFATPSGKFNTQTPEYTDPAEKPDEQYPLILTTFRYVGQYHTATMTHRSVHLRKRWPEPVAEIHPETARKYGVRDGGLIKIITRRGEYTCRVKVTNLIAKDVVAVPWHFGANVLTNDALDPVAKIPETKVCACKVVPVEER